VLRANYNSDADLELLVGIHDPKHKRRVPLPRTTEEEVVLIHHPALTRKFKRRAQHPRRSQFTLQTPVRTSLAWLAAILAIVGVLTAMLMMGIAISV
jgi:hypothetical protein